ncbi:hypothetical protein GCM10010293_40260 [Streptomyces griseoflavus]|uniref:hypothetical protein n=1 Tax=Streptomyces griseoflavus TaxID=35619 RepID=UPI00167D179F|nr:hypothetical protein [Streptomyces griseoflavus]GGV36793.1 hypothetical protein GCM10010293_40260 [Streptomyces griseoflavus]
MTDSRPLSDADLLAWAVVLAYRDQQERDGITILLLPFPPCPTCGETVHEAIASWVREPLREEMTIDVRPCEHDHKATIADLERIHDHASEMLDSLRLDNRLPGEESRTTEQIVAEARARVGQPEPTAMEAAEPELTVEEARDLVDELGTDLYWAQDRLGFIGECCDIADREQRPITTADVRKWLKGARCGRQLAADAAAAAGTTEPAPWSQLEAHAFNAVQPALNKAGAWLPMSHRRAVAKAVLAAVQPHLAGHYQHAVDATVAAEQRADEAEAKLARVQQLVDAYPCNLDPALIAEALNEPRPTPNTGPSVRECAEADREYWERKDAEEAP